MGSSRLLPTVAAVAAASALWACAKGGDDGQARRQPSAPGQAAAPNATAQDVGAGPVTCAAGEIFVSNVSSGGVTVHDRASSGNTAPLRWISSYWPRCVAADAAHDEIVVTGGGSSIAVFARDAASDAAPLRTIAGSSTGLTSAAGVDVDPVHDEIVVADGSRVAVFARSATGDVAPLRAITRSSFLPAGVAVDLANDELVVTTSPPSAPPEIVVFARTASGAATPLRTITGTATGLGSPHGVAVDAARGEIVVAECGSSGGIKVFSRTASGNVAPLRTVTLSTGPFCPTDVVVDADRDEYLAANWSGGSVAALSRTASGNVTPLRTLSGPMTGFTGPWDLALLSRTTSCAQGSACAAGGCMPAGAVDCADGRYCPQGAACSTSDGVTWCAGILPEPRASGVCAFGTVCPSGSVCASGGCMPAGAMDCGGGAHCAPGSACSASGSRCFPAGAVDCQNGRSCPFGTGCTPDGLWCLPPDAVDCGDGWYCASGKVCAPSANGIECEDPAAPPGGGGGAYCYSTSACIPSALSDTCECAGATSPGECVSGHAACSAAGGPCGDGVHACCVGETCIYNRCVAGCGQCAGKGCRLQQ